MLHLYKKFGLNLMARLTDVVLDLGTTMEVLPASEDKSKILRILDLENFNAPEDLENIIPRNSSVLEVSVTDVIYHMNNRSLSTDVEDLSMFGMMPQVRSPPLPRVPEEIEIASNVPFQGLRMKFESQKSDDNDADVMMTISSVNGSDDFEFSDDGKEALHVPLSSIDDDAAGDAQLPTMRDILKSPPVIRTQSLKVHTGISYDGFSLVSPLSVSENTTNETPIDGFSPFETALSCHSLEDCVPVVSLTSMGKFAVCSLADGNMNVINMETGQSVSFPSTKNATSSDASVLLAPLPPPPSLSSVYAGVSFSGDVYKTSAAYAGIQYCGQGFISAAKDGTIHAWALPSDPFREPPSSADSLPGLDVIRGNLIFPLYFFFA